VQVNCRLREEEALGFPAQWTYPLNVATRSVSFSYGIVVLVRQALEVLVQEDEWISRHGLVERLLRLPVLIRNPSSAA
jgi:hypothetical protein